VIIRLATVADDFYQAVPSTNTNPGGEIAMIDPKAMQVMQVYPLTDCNPAGTAIGTAAMRALPVGVPKLMVSTMASGQVRPYVGQSDVCLMYSVVDVSGLNRISRRVLANAAAAVAGMAKEHGRQAVSYNHLTLPTTSPV